MNPAIFGVLAPILRQQQQARSALPVPQFRMPNVAAPDYSGAMAQERQAEGLLGQLMNMQAPAPVNPAFRTEDAIKGIIGLLLGGGRNPEEFITGYLGGKQNLAQQDTQRQGQEFERKRQNVGMMAEQAQRRAGLLREQEGDRYNREYKQAFDTATRDYERDKTVFNEGSRLIRDLDAVKSEAGLLGIQEAARQLGVQLDPRAVAEVQKVIQAEKEQANLLKQQQADDRRLGIQRNAATNWDARLNQFRDDYGLIKPEAYAQLMKERDSFAKQFGIQDVNVLQMPYAEVTMARERLSKYGQDLANKWANAKVRLDYERQRLEQAEQRLALGQSQFAALERDRAEKNYMARLKEYNKIAGDIAGSDSADAKTLGELDRKIVGLRAKQNAMRDVDDRRKIEEQIIEIDAIRKFIRESMAQQPSTDNTGQGQGTITPLNPMMGGPAPWDNPGTDWIGNGPGGIGGGGAGGGGGTGGGGGAGSAQPKTAKDRLDELRRKGVKFNIR